MLKLLKSNYIIYIYDNFLITILFSIFFALYSLIIFFKYDSPIISYSKGNDKKTKREFFLKDSFLMFELIDSTTVENLYFSEII